MTPTPDSPAAARVQGRLLFDPGRGPLRVSYHQPQHDVVAHDHDFLEIVLVTSGRAIHQTIYGKRSLRRGDLILIRPRLWHAYRQCHKFSLWNCCLGPQILGPPLGWIDHGSVVANLIWSGGSANTTRGPLEVHLNETACRNLVQRLRKVADADRKSLELVGWLYLVLHVVIQHLKDTSGIGPAVKELHPAVRHTLELIEAEPDQARSLEELARHARINPSYLARLFRQQLNTSPIDLLLRLRCERAAGLLLSTDLPIAEVGYRVGWDDPNYFTKRFRANFGQSPSDYRRHMRGR